MTTEDAELCEHDWETVEDGEWVEVRCRKCDEVRSIPRPPEGWENPQA